MMKHEFEAGIGMEVPQAIFDRVNYVYMESEFFQTKEQVYIFWEKHDMNGFERLYKEVLKAKTLEAELKAARAEVATLRQGMAVARQMLENLTVEETA